MKMMGWRSSRLPRRRLRRRGNEGASVGDIAPAFTLPGSDGKTHRLADFKGKETVVLAWFPKAFTVAERPNARRSVRAARRFGRSMSPTSQRASTMPRPIVNSPSRSAWTTRS